jgi:hypothetical protein
MTITLILMIATLLAMVVGLVFMAIGGKLNRKYSNKLMSLRVLMQVLSVASIGLLYIFSKH